MQNRLWTAVLLIFAVSMLPINSAAGAVAAKNANGSSISVPTQILKKNSVITVSGKGFDETVGIYLAYCVLPKPGGAPTPCGGGINKSGTGDSSLWISSNPPPYGVGLAIEYQPGGRFQEKVGVTRKIGKFDCTKVKCAITVRSDHTREGDRSHDIFLPIVFK